MRKRIALAAALLAAPGLASAEQPNLYFGAAIGGYEVDQEDVGGDVDDATNLDFRLGYHLFDFIGVEARAGGNTGGVSGDSSAPDTRYVGVFGRFDIPFEKVNVYLLVGASEVELDGETVDDDEYDPVAGGLGIELYGSERTAITLEYMSYSDNAYSGVNLGIKYHFDLPPLR